MLPGLLRPVNKAEANIHRAVLLQPRDLVVFGGERPIVGSLV
jgi:hypothetical protein